jgi:ribosomal protein L40E
MSWVRRHPFAAAIFAIIFVIFALAAIFADTDEEGTRTEAALGLVIIYVLIVGFYALIAWIVRKIRGGSESQPQYPVPPMPASAQQQFPQWDWSARAPMPSSAAPQAPVIIPCRQCGAANPPDAAFCDQCGARLTIPAAPPMPTAEDAVECPRCHTKQSPRVRYCTNCGLPRSSV